MNKRGQVYLIAALVIIGIAVSLATVTNTVKTAEEDLTVYDLSREINYEASQVIDHGTFNPDAQPDNLKNLIVQYSDLYPDSGIVAIYGDSENLQAIQCGDVDTGSVGIIIGGESVSVNVDEKDCGDQYLSTDSRSSGDVRIDMATGGQLSFPFRLREGENFFLILQKEKGRERFVAGTGDAERSTTDIPDDCGTESGKKCCTGSNKCPGTNDNSEKLVCHPNGLCGVPCEEHKECVDWISDIIDDNTAKKYTCNQITNLCDTPPLGECDENDQCINHYSNAYPQDEDLSNYYYCEKDPNLGKYRCFPPQPCKNHEECEEISRKYKCDFEAPGTDQDTGYCTDEN